MALDVETLTAIRDNLLTAAASFATDAAAGRMKPSYNIDGQQLDWLAYQKYLDSRIAELNKQINTFDGGLVESFEF